MVMNPVRVLLAAALVTSIASAANATTINYSDFSSVAGLTLNGDAAQAGSVLRVVPSADTQAGTAYSSTAVPLNASTSFSTSFEFLVTTDPSSGLGVPDGFAFLLQRDAAGAHALGAGGQGLGYVGLSPSVAVVFRGRGPSFIGVITGGTDPANLSNPFDPPGSTSFGTDGAFYEQNEFAWIDYDAGTHLLDVYLSTTSVKPGAAVMEASLDLFGELNSHAHVGFSAGNGGAFGSQDILNWSFTSDAVTVPEPSSLALFGAGLLSLFGFAMLRKRAA